MRHAQYMLLFLVLAINSDWYRILCSYTLLYSSRPFSCALVWTSALLTEVIACWNIIVESCLASKHPSIADVYYIAIMTVLHSVQYLPTPVVDTLVYTSFLIFELIRGQRWPLNCKSMILKSRDNHFVWNHCVNQMIKRFRRKHVIKLSYIYIFFAEQRCWSWSQMLQWAKSKWLYILTLYLPSLTTLFHFERLNFIFSCAHTCTDMDRGAGERAAAAPQWFNTTPVTPTSLHQDVDVGMECIQEDTGVHFWVDISNMAYSDVLLAVVSQPGTKAMVLYISVMDF